jgi:hypothetical protein
MHTNHRRKTVHRAKHHNARYLLIPSLKWYRQRASKDRRALERDLVAHERYDDLPTRYPRNIYWNLW